MEVSAQLNGWFAIGTGGEMAGSDMLVAWENAGSIITSQRSVSAEFVTSLSLLSTATDLGAPFFSQTGKRRSHADNCSCNS